MRLLIVERHTFPFKIPRYVTGHDWREAFIELQVAIADSYQSSAPRHVDGNKVGFGEVTVVDGSLSVTVECRDTGLSMTGQVYLLAGTLDTEEACDFLSQDHDFKELNL